MARLVVVCVPVESGGQAVDPCGSIDGVAHQPSVEPLVIETLDFSQSGELYVWSLSLVLVVFVVGLTVGAIMRVVRSA